MTAVYAADSDDNPNDEAAGDGRSNIDLRIRGNTISANGTYEGAVAIGGGYSVGGFSPSPDIVYLSKYEATDNLIIMNPDAAFIAGMSYGLVGGGAVVAGNVISIRGGSLGQTHAIVSMVAGGDIYNNTIAITGSAAAGVPMIAIHNMMIDDAIAANFAGVATGAVANNIFHFDLLGDPTCHAYAYLEGIVGSDASLKTRINPTIFKNNDIYMNVVCTGHALYYDNQMGPVNKVTDIDALNAKAGFEAGDNTEFSGNISLSPLFVDVSNGDLHLQEASPCVDAGISIGEIGADRDGVARPSGAGPDVGAYER